MRPRLRTTLVLLAVLVLGLPAAAHASSGGDQVIRDCADDGQLSKHYTQKQLQDAYNNLPSDIDEYTDCRSVIRAAMSGGSGSPGAPPPNGVITPSGAVAASPADVQALAQLTSGQRKRPAIQIGGQKVLPGNAGLSGIFGGLAGSNGMPGSLIAAIVALAILAVVVSYLTVRQKAPHVLRLALRVFGR